MAEPVEDPIVGVLRQEFEQQAAWGSEPGYLDLAHVICAHIAAALATEVDKWASAANVEMQHPTDGRPARARDELDVAARVTGNLHLALLGCAPTTVGGRGSAPPHPEVRHRPTLEG